MREGKFDARYRTPSQPTRPKATHEFHAHAAMQGKSMQEFLRARR
jgi:hypothetical protein